MAGSPTSVVTAARRSEPSGEPYPLLAAADVVAALELGAATSLQSAVDLDRALDEQGLDRSPGFHQTGQLEQLSESNSGLAHRYLLHGAAHGSVAGKGGMHMGVAESALDAQVSVGDVVVLW